MVDIRREERAAIEELGRCSACDHLLALHYSYDNSCRIAGCGCAYGKTPEQQRREDERYRREMRAYKEKWIAEHPGEDYDAAHPSVQTTTFVVNVGGGDIGG